MAMEKILKGTLLIKTLTTLRTNNFIEHFIIATRYAIAVLIFALSTVYHTPSRK